MSDPAHPARNKPVLIGLFAIGLVLAAVICARLLMGSASLGWPDGENAQYIQADRIARVILGLIVGVALSISGVSLQSLLRNPLAEPYILGLSTGAGAGIMVQSYLFFLFTAKVSVGTNIGGALIGAAATMLIVFLASRRKGMIDPLGLLLTGVVLSTICGALILMMNYLVGPGGIRDNIARWMMGNLEVPADPEYLIVIAARTVDAMNTVLGTLHIPYDVPIPENLIVWLMGAMTMLGLGVLVLRSRAMDVASNSDTETMSLGVNLPRLRVVLFSVSSLLAAGAVVLAGPIAFVGLICPHIARIVLGPRHGPLLIGSAMLGAALVIAADTASAVLNLWLGIGLMPIGIFTAIVGGPVFLWMLHPQLGRGDA